MNEIQSSLLALLPPKRKSTPSGWISFNAVCCHHRGQSLDKRSRGGVLTTPTGGFNFHCFNCNFKAGWTPGKLLSNNTKSLFRWLGMSDTDIQKLGLVALQLKDDVPTEKKILNFELIEKQLPSNTKSLDEWIKLGPPKDVEPVITEVVKYLLDRGMDLNWYPWHYSTESGYKDRVIIPFYFQGKVVGWTGRKITSGKPKYLTDSQNGYVFNLDRQTNDKQYLIVVEGQFDAIAVDGVAIMHNEPNEVQCSRINALNKQVILVPDRDKAGSKLINAALEHGWQVSLPPWGDDIKDVADAVNVYGRLYTLMSIIHYKEANELKIQLLKKKLENLND